MEEAIIHALKSSPNLLANVFIVIVFLKYLKDKSEQFNLTIRDVTTKCHECHKEATKAIKENSIMLGELKGTLRDINDNIE